MVRDLICSIEVDETKAGATYDYEEQTYYFCTPECKDRFVDLMSPQMKSFRSIREAGAILGDD